VKPDSETVVRMSVAVSNQREQVRRTEERLADERNRLSKLTAALDQLLGLPHTPEPEVFSWRGTTRSARRRKP
jgi:hypothetical protein